MTVPTPARVLQFTGLLHETGWFEPAYAALDASGCTVAIGREPPKAALPVEQIPAYAVPGFCNAHSHAFQYAMAGLSEFLPPAARSDDFWSWREAMYSLANKLTPEQLER